PEDASEKAQEESLAADSNALDEAQALAQTVQKEPPKPASEPQPALDEAQTPAQAAPKEPPKPAAGPRLSARKEVAALQLKAAQIEALMNGRLGLEIDPNTLFHIDLSDSETASIEARWLSSIIERVGGEKKDASSEEGEEAQAKD